MPQPLANLAKEEGEYQFSFSIDQWVLDEHSSTDSMKANPEQIMIPNLNEQPVEVVVVQ